MALKLPVINPKAIETYFSHSKKALQPYLYTLGHDYHTFQKLASWLFGGISMVDFARIALDAKKKRKMLNYSMSNKSSISKKDFLTS